MSEAAVETVDTNVASDAPLVAPPMGPSGEPAVDPGLVPGGEPAPDSTADAPTAEAGESTTATQSESSEPGAPASDVSVTSDVAADLAELTLPDGYLMSEEALDQHREWAQQQGLGREQAEAILARDAARDAAIAGAEEAKAEDQVAKYVADLKADREIGGDALEDSVHLAKKAFRQLGTPALTEIFNETGLGSHPEVVRLLWRVGKALSEDNSNDHSTPPRTELPLANRLVSEFK